MEDVSGRQLDQDVEEQLLGQTHPAHDDTLSMITGHLVWRQILVSLSLALGGSYF